MNDAPNEDPLAAGDAEGTFEGRTFPSESQWLSLPPPAIAEDFVLRTLAALRKQAELPGQEVAPVDSEAVDSGAVDSGAVDSVTEPVTPPLSPSLLAAYRAPEPAADFVARTMRTLEADRRKRFGMLMAKYVAPEPSAEFVNLTLQALAGDHDAGDRVTENRIAGNRGMGNGLTGQPGGAAPRVDPRARAGNASRGSSATQRTRRGFAWVAVLAAAAALVVWVRPSATLPSLEQRIAAASRPSFAHGYAATPLPSLLAGLEEEDAPDALPSSNADGIWLLMHRERR